MERNDNIKINWLKTVRHYLRTHLSVMIFLLALILAVTNYLIYPAFLNQRFDLVEVAVVNGLIKPNTKITEKDIIYITFPVEAIPTDIYIKEDEVIDRFTSEHMTLVKGSFFYKEMLVDTSSSSKSFTSKLDEDDFAYPLIVAQESGLKGRLEPGAYVDLFFQASERNNEDKMIIGKLMEHVRIIDIDFDENNKSEQLILAVKEDDLDHLIAAKSIGTIYPYVSWQSSEDDHVKSDIYDIQATRQILQTRIYDLRYFESVEPDLEP